MSRAHGFEGCARRAATRMIGVAGLTSLLGACATLGPDYTPPVTDAEAQAAFVSDPAVDLAAGQEPAHTWWQALDDATLAGLVERALEENRDIRQAAANVTAARRLLRLEQTSRRPQGELNATFQRRRLAGAAFGFEDVTFPDTNFYDLTANLSWELDFFGRVRRGVEAALADAQAAEALRRDAQVLVVAEMVTAYTDYRGAEVQLRVARDNLRIQQQSAELTRVRFEEGLGELLDVRRAEAQVKSTEATIPPLEAQRAAAANRMATLTAQPLSAVLDTLADDEASLPAPPQTLAVGDPGGLVQRRADVRAAERELAAATARLGVARTAWFPRLSLVGSLGSTSETLSGISQEPALGYGIGPQLVWNGFDLPRVRAEIGAADARAQAALASYEQTVLVALEEVQSSLAGYGRERVRYAALEAAVEKTREASALARVRYEGGADDFLAVLDAEQRLLQAEAARAESVTAVTRRYAQVYRSLGAGWLP